MPFYDANGNELEIPALDGPVLELPLGAMPALAAVMDFPMIQRPAQRIGLLYIAVTTPFAWVTSGQPTVQTYVGRTQATAVDAFHPLAGTAVNLGPAAATSLAAQLWVVSTTTMADLGLPHAYQGIRLSFPSAPSAGAAALYFEFGAY